MHSLDFLSRSRTRSCVDTQTGQPETSSIEMSRTSLSSAAGSSTTSLTVDGTNLCPEEEKKKTLKCFSCSNVLSVYALYRCRDCFESVTSTAGCTIKARPVYCKMCIVVNHLRQKHAIIDCRGYVPAICEQHENLFQYFCYSCQMIFCTDCLEFHLSHNFQPLSAKASEVRKIVFETMMKNEELIKPIKLKQSVALACVAANEKLSNSLTNDKLAETLRVTFERTIRQNAHKWHGTQEKLMTKRQLTGKGALFEAVKENDVEKIQALAKKIDAKDMYFRDLLLKSEGEIIRCFLESMDQFENLLNENEQKDFENHIFTQWSDSLEFLIQDFVGKVVNSLLIPEIGLVKMSKIDLKLDEKIGRGYQTIDCQLMKVTRERDQLVTRVWTDEIVKSKVDGKNFECTLILEKKQSHQIETFRLLGGFVQNVFFYSGYLALFTADNIMFVYCLRKKAFVYRLSLALNYRPLALFAHSDKRFSCLASAGEKPNITVQISSGFESAVLTKLTEEPKLVELFEHTFLFVLQTNSLVIYNAKANIQVDVSNLHHGLSSIDKIKLAGRKTLFLFDYKMLLAAKFSFNVDSEATRSFTLEKVFKISKFSKHPVTHMTVGTGVFIAYSDSSQVYSEKITTM